MKKSKKYSRKTTSITISLFYEQFQLSKYNLDPPYQRDANIWDEKQKSFLIDSILKNFPIPPIFLEQKIESKTGKTNFDVIDGKQRLSTIIDFISNKIKLPETFGNDDYGYEKLNGKTFDELMDIAECDEVVKEFISEFWSYTISIEYIEKPDTKVVDNIFDRLNREGSRLNPAELRKAQYYDTSLYSAILSARNHQLFKELLDRKRLTDISFITELFMLLELDKVIDGSETIIDTNFAELVEVIDDEKGKYLCGKLKKLESIVTEFNLDYATYRIGGTSHLYAIFYLANYMYNNNIDLDDCIKGKLVQFFEDLRGEKKHESVVIYNQSMQSASKSASARKRRVKALLHYMGYAQ